MEQIPRGNEWMNCFALTLYSRGCDRRPGHRHHTRRDLHQQREFHGLAVKERVCHVRTHSTQGKNQWKQWDC
jgi:hypothetical protein